MPVHPVAIPSARYNELKAKRNLPRTLMGGTTAMRAAKTTYLPKYPAEAPKVYNTRLAGTFLFPAFKDAVYKQSSKFFREPILVTKAPEPVKVLVEDIDGEGRAVTPFAMDLTREAFADGIAFILVDMPPVQQGATMADQKAIGARPYWVMFTANDIIGWHSASFAGKQMLTQVRIKQCTYEVAGAFGEVEVKRIRVFDADGVNKVKWTVWRAHKKEGTQEEEWRIETEGELALTYIPLVPLYVNRVGFMEGEPPMDGLAELNQEHWLSSSEQRNALTFLRFSMLALIGVEKPDRPKKRAPNLAQGETGEGEEPKIEIGPSKVLYVPTGGDAKYVEHNGKGIEAGSKDLEAIEKRMQTTGIALRVENQGKVTATASALDSAETNAAMKAIAKGLKDCIEQACNITAEWLNIIDAKCEAKVYDEFGESVTEVTLDQLLKVRAAREMSQPTFWEELKRRGILSDDFDETKEKELLAADEAADMEKMATALDTVKKQQGTAPVGPPKIPAA